MWFFAWLLQGAQRIVCPPRVFVPSGAWDVVPCSLRLWHLLRIPALLLRARCAHLDLQVPHRVFPCVCPRLSIFVYFHWAEVLLSSLVLYRRHRFHKRLYRHWYFCINSDFADDFMCSSARTVSRWRGYSKDYASALHWFWFPRAVVAKLCSFLFWCSCVGRQKHFHCLRQTPSMHGCVDQDADLDSTPDFVGF